MKKIRKHARLLKTFILFLMNFFMQAYEVIFGKIHTSPNKNSLKKIKVIRKRACFRIFFIKLPFKWFLNDKNQSRNTRGDTNSLHGI